MNINNEIYLFTSPIGIVAEPEKQIIYYRTALSLIKIIFDLFYNFVSRGNVCQELEYFYFSFLLGIYSEAGLICFARKKRSRAGTVQRKPDHKFIKGLSVLVPSRGGVCHRRLTHQDIINLKSNKNNSLLTSSRDIGQLILHLEDNDPVGMHRAPSSKYYATNEYLKQFFVGLLEGDGSINVTLKNNNYL
uniref:LAGLIDADG endonuclease n=1 Tax=Elmerina hispida TaxID=1245649 RepID=UPI003002E2AB|nr:LAGLIDADG endonuclease [Elmerina hispida]